MRERKFSPFIGKPYIIILAFLSIVCIMCGGFLAADSAIFIKDADEITGTVVDVHIIHRSKSSDICSATVLYTVDGTEYKYYYPNIGRGYFIRKSDYEGMKVKLLCSRTDPLKVRSAKKPFAKPGVIILAGITAAAGCGYIIRRNRFYEFLINNGAVLDAVVIDVDHSNIVHSGRRHKGIYTNTNIKSYTEHYSMIICEWQNPVTGEVFRFNSQKADAFFDPYVGETVRVYADPNDYSKYFVDIDDLLSKPFKK